MAQPRRLGEALAGNGVKRRPLPPRELYPNGSAESGGCPVCKGAGWLRIDVPFGSPMFGQPIMCECLRTRLEQERFDKFVQRSGLDSFAEMTFDNFDAERERVPGLEEAYKKARKFADDPKGWIVLFGRPGVGKTHLAAAIANRRRQVEPTLLFKNVPDLLDHLRSAFSPSSPMTYDDLFESVRTCTLLILDDLGTENATPWAEEKLYQIINHRYVDRLPTVITSNQRPNRIDDRIYSRMTDRGFCEVIEIDATDYRQRKDGQRWPPARKSKL